MQGAVWLLCNLQSPVCNASEYKKGLQRCLEECGVQYMRLYSDNITCRQTDRWNNEVESIVDSKYRYQCIHYLIKFNGWPDSNNEWLPADHLANAPEVIRDFHDHHPSTPTPCHASHPQ